MLQAVIDQQQHFVVHVWSDQAASPQQLRDMYFSRWCYLRNKMPAVQYWRLRTHLLQAAVDQQQYLGCTEDVDGCTKDIDHQRHFVANMSLCRGQRRIDGRDM